MKIKWLKEENMNELKSKISKNIDKYEKDNDWIDENWFKEYSKEFPDFELYVGDRDPPKTDLENIKRLYKNLKELTDSQARDERVWAGLCHNKFWNYVKYRYPISKAKDTKENSILNHYFIKGSGVRGLNFNALSRLWWVGRLTYDENSDNPFILTEYLCDDLAPKLFLLLGTNFSNNKRVLNVFLSTLMNFEKNNKLSREEFNKMTVIMNLWGGSIILDSLSNEELSKKINNYLNEVIVKERETNPIKEKRKKPTKNKKQKKNRK